MLLCNKGSNEETEVSEVDVEGFVVLRGGGHSVSGYSHSDLSKYFRPAEPSNHDPKCYHECPECNWGCNCAGDERGKCVCCVEPTEKPTDAGEGEPENRLCPCMQKRVSECKCFGEPERGRNTCLECGAEKIMGTGYCSKECANKAFEKDGDNRLCPCMQKQGRECRCFGEPQNRAFVNVYLQKVLNEVKFPCYYDKDSQMIFDQEGRLICDVRGWGWIQKLGEDAEKMQDAMGEDICRLFNGLIRTK